MKDAFSSYHPILNFTYFCGVICFSMVFLHPATLALSFFGAFSYALRLYGKKALLNILRYLLPMVFVASLVNPLFNHEGMTILFYLRDNPVTRESILYGLATGSMFGSVILWFSCYNKVMTSDKFMYLFGKRIPALSLVFSMILRFVPHFQEQAKVIIAARCGIGKSVNEGNLFSRMKNGTKILSVLVSWALEHSMETADSMRSRGYGLPGRTTYSLYRFDSRDRLKMLLLSGLVVLIVVGGFSGQYFIQYFPVFSVGRGTMAGKLIFIPYGLLCFAPVLTDLAEDWRWRYLRSKI